MCERCGPPDDASSQKPTRFTCTRLSPSGSPLEITHIFLSLSKADLASSKAHFGQSETKPPSPSTLNWTLKVPSLLCPARAIRPMNELTPTSSASFESCLKPRSVTLVLETLAKALSRASVIDWRKHSLELPSSQLARCFLPDPPETSFTPLSKLSGIVWLRHKNRLR